MSEAPRLFKGEQSETQGQGEDKQGAIPRLKEAEAVMQGQASTVGDQDEWECCKDRKEEGDGGGEQRLEGVHLGGEIDSQGAAGTELLDAKPLGWGELRLGGAHMNGEGDDGCECAEEGDDQAGGDGWEIEASDPA